MIENTFKDISVTPFPLKSLLTMEIHQKINEHALLHITGLLESGQMDNCIYEATEGTKVEVTAFEDNTPQPLFTGMVQEISTRHENDVFFLDFTAISNTYLMDIQLKDKSFQDKNMSYTNMLKDISHNYPQGDMMDMATNGSNIGKYILQHQETDWKFCKRIASRFNTVLIPFMKLSGPKYYMGLPQETPINLDEFNYSIIKKIDNYLLGSKNTNPNLILADSIYFNLETTKILPLGAPVVYRHSNLYVCEINSCIQNSLLTHVYTLTTKNSMSQSTYHNNRTAGLSIKGKVLDRIQDRVKVHMEIDPTQETTTAWEFPYSTSYTAEGSSGWYCMPEVGDTVYIYHPNSQEGGAFAINGTRENNSSSDKISDPNIKYFRTADGKELKFSPKEILITAKDDEIYLLLSEDTGIKLYSTLPIEIITDDDLSIRSENKLKIEARESIEMSCRSSTIKLDDANIAIQGKEIRNN